MRGSCSRGKAALLCCVPRWRCHWGLTVLAVPTTVDRGHRGGQAGSNDRRGKGGTRVWSSDCEVGTASCLAALQTWCGVANENTRVPGPARSVGRHLMQCLGCRRGTSRPTSPTSEDLSDLKSVCRIPVLPYGSVGGVGPLWPFDTRALTTGASLSLPRAR